MYLRKKIGFTLFCVANTYLQLEVRLRMPGGAIRFFIIKSSNGCYRF